ncbi:unnamed protein product [Oppiella nova]|uniref:RING-type domain-containing protein n=1 Tax=Oppiella nova TaxID=334625 RepID=A0A7R9M367_9ACAR|nr:unnamed protein product [Oppiella nova]CAG2169890.1 unnamed protein product [Oppiella nova]
MPGYDLSRFPNLSAKEKAEYTCSICQDIFCCPMTTPCCLQTFCEDCITGWLQNNTSCPYDRKTLTIDKLSRAPRVLVNMLGNLNIKCEFWDNGCREVYNLEDLIQHNAICEHNEANRPKTCDVCYCDKTRDHDCVEALLEDKCNANDEINFLKRTVKELKIEKDNFLKTIQEMSSDHDDNSLMVELRQLRMTFDKQSNEHDLLRLRIQYLEENELLPEVLNMMLSDYNSDKELVGKY